MNIKTIREYLSDEDIKTLLDKHYSGIEGIEIADNFIGIWNQKGELINFCSNDDNSRMLDILIEEAERIIIEINLEIILKNHERNCKK